MIPSVIPQRGEMIANTHSSNDENVKLPTQWNIPYSQFLLKLFGRIRFGDACKLYPHQVCDCEIKCGLNQRRYNTISYCYKCHYCSTRYCIDHYLCHRIVDCHKCVSIYASSSINKKEFNKSSATCTNIKSLEIILRNKNRKFLDYIDSHYLHWINIEEITLKNDILEDKEINEITRMICTKSNLLQKVYSNLDYHNQCLYKGRISSAIHDGDKQQHEINICLALIRLHS